MDKAGFAGNDSFTGAGKSIATIRLEGRIFLQDIPSRAPGRFPVTLNFVTDNFECWGLAGISRYS